MLMFDKKKLDGKPYHVVHVTLLELFFFWPQPFFINSEWKGKLILRSEDTVLRYIFDSRAILWEFQNLITFVFL